MPAENISRCLKAAALATLALAVAACGEGGRFAAKETADQFVARLNRELYDLGVEQAEAGWVQQTYITKDTQAISARATDRGLAYFTTAVKAAKAYDGQKLSPATARSIM